ncbi:dihydrodipicolinate synthase family protein [Candidatus Micrarchaeota archaeon]|nr:dihydrodipicolinate synthase family protein [Candidatus Micrarchaeota archaeon]
MIATNLRNPKVQGVLVPLVTPLNEKREVDAKSVKRLLQSLKSRVDGFIPCLSTGEGRNLNDRSWRTMLEFTLAETSGTMVIAGIEASATSDVVRRVKETRTLGVDVVIALPQFGANIPQDKIFAHFATIAEAGLEIIVYNKQMMCGTPIHINTLIRICRQIPAIIGVKEGSMDPAFTQQFLDAVPDVAVFLAWEHLFTKNAAHGSIAALSNLEPELCREGVTNQNMGAQNKINDAIARYNIGSENTSWFYDIKLELVRRGIIETTYCIV